MNNKTYTAIIFCCLSSTLQYAMGEIDSSEFDHPNSGGNIEKSPESRAFYKIVIANYCRNSLGVSFFNGDKKIKRSTSIQYGQHVFDKVERLPYIKLFHPTLRWHTIKKIKGDFIVIQNNDDDYNTTKITVAQYDVDGQFGHYISWLPDHNCTDQFEWINYKKRSFLEHHWYYRTESENLGTLAGALSPVFVPLWLLFSLAVEPEHALEEIRQVSRPFLMGFLSGTSLPTMALAFYCMKK